MKLSWTKWSPESIIYVHVWAGLRFTCFWVVKITPNDKIERKTSRTEEEEKKNGSLPILKMPREYKTDKTDTFTVSSILTGIGIRHKYCKYQAIYPFIANWISFHINFVSSVFFYPIACSLRCRFPVLKVDTTRWSEKKEEKGEKQTQENPSRKTNGLFLWLTPAS